MVECGALRRAVGGQRVDPLLSERALAVRLRIVAADVYLDKAERRLSRGDCKGAWISLARAAFDEAQDQSELSAVLTRGRVLRSRVGDERWARNWDRVLDAVQANLYRRSVPDTELQEQPMPVPAESANGTGASSARGARGRNGTITVSPPSLMIDIDGARGRYPSNRALVGTVTVNLTDVADVRWKGADPIANGYLQLDVRTAASGGSAPIEATLVFTIRQQAAFISVFELLNQYLKSAQTTTIVEAGSPDPIRQLERIAALYSVGALTPSEFLEQKKKLLARL